MKKKINYTLSVKASIDLKEIAVFTIKKFGIQQSEIYRDSLVEILNKLGKHPEIGREYIAIKDKMLSRYRFKAHTIFFYPLEEKIFVVRILGNNMSFIKHLKPK
ncbi:type II toxin-antitoxin system RelE/ParE family toxin [Aquimarina agarilytica]|uniref:type II toxin-antitoxin system RelE/ParE family toxin n=1 Tax=Aquimarina agarilytica TaxID=1087449 RepID=UPI000289AAD6|nr:type II toxin-antitoxin system RelE/ParE family toxin [Aquimarina agarilytica]